MPSWLSWIVPEGWSGQDIAIAVAILSIGSAIVSLLVVSVTVIRIPVDYFINPNAQGTLIRKHPVIRWSLIILKNLLGTILILIGVILSLPGVPGQGLLTILIGLLLVDLPRKRRLEIWLLQRKGVLVAINRIRARFGHLPLQLTVPFSAETGSSQTAVEPKRSELRLGVPNAQNPISPQGN